MKHPALTRLFSVVLAVLSLAMMIAGFGSISGAVSDRKKGLADLDRLRARADEYRQVQDALAGKTKYEEANRALTEELSKHDSFASKHRVNLALYTATKGGLTEGEAAFAEANYAFYKGKAQYENALKLFKEKEDAFWEGYKQYEDARKQLEDAKKQLEPLESALAGLRAQQQQIRSMAALLESDDPDARRDLSLAAYDEMLHTLDMTVNLYQSVKDQGGISGEQMKQLVTLLAQDSDLDLSDLLDSITWQDITADDMQAFEDGVVAATGMSIGEIRAQIQQQRDSIAQMDADVPISEEAFAAMQQGYAMSRAWLLEIDSALDRAIAEYEAKLAEIRAPLDAAQAKLDEMGAVLEQAKLALEQGKAALELAGKKIKDGEIALYDGLLQLKQKRAELEEQLKTLKEEKAKLDKESAELTRKMTQVDKLHDLERKEISLRMLLLDRREIADRVDSGMELLSASDEYAAFLQQQTESQTAGRLRIGILMVAGAVAAFFGIPAAFEKIKSRFLLIMPVIACLGFAVAAEVFCRQMGRGDTYSALAVAFFAVVQLLLVLPKKRTAH